MGVTFLASLTTAETSSLGPGLPIVTLGAYRAPPCEFTAAPPHSPCYRERHTGSTAHPRAVSQANVFHSA